jgi:putative transposase
MDRPECLAYIFQNPLIDRFERGIERTGDRVPLTIESRALTLSHGVLGCFCDRQTGAAPDDLGHLRRYNLTPAPERVRTTTWKEFIRAHMDVLAGTDFFTVEVLTWRGLVTYYVLFFIEVGSRRVSLGGITRHPDSGWMEQVARNATMQDTGYLNGCRYLLHDRDKKFCREFQKTLAAGGVECTPIPARSPNLNAHSERWVRSVKEECLSKLILFGDGSLRRVVSEYLQHYHQERNHQGKGNVLLFPASTPSNPGLPGAIGCRERLGGLLKYYRRAA